jgi:AcrR family transcriptional regulator
VTIGTLAESLGLSKSGVFAHFRSKDALDVALIEHAAECFVDCVIRPALAAAPGEPRLRVLFERVLDWPARSGLPGGCPMIAAAAELDDCPCAAREVLVAQQRHWLATLSELARGAVREGHFGRALEPEQLAWELYGIQLAHHHATRLLRDPSAGARATAAFSALLHRARSVRELPDA